jgi:osmotically-inducible protein OsmY
MKRLTAIFLLCSLFLFSTVGAFAQKSRSDDQIYDLVRQKLANDPDVKGGALQVDVKEGVVTIRGEVEKERQRQKAERIAHKVKGVKSVNNQLTLKK